MLKGPIDVVLALIAVMAVTASDTGKHVHYTADAGLVSTSGNTNNTSVNVGDQIVAHVDGWTFTQRFTLVYGHDDSVVTASAWHGSLRAERTLTPRVGLFMLTEFDRDSFAGISSRVTPQVGVSVGLVTAPHDTLLGEAGATYTWQNGFAPDTARVSGGARLAGTYLHHFPGKAVFAERIEYLPNLKVGADYRINSETALTAPISAGLSFKAAYSIRYNNLPEPTFKTTDRTLTTGLQIAF